MNRALEHSLGLALVVALVTPLGACTAIFSAAKGDAAAEDAGAEDSGVATVCNLSLPSGLLRIANGTSVDLDGDGNDEVVLHTTPDNEGIAPNYVRSGDCPLEPTWTYSSEWAPMLADSTVGFSIHEAVFVEGRGEADMLAALGTDKGIPQMASFQIVDGNLQNTPHVEFPLFDFNNSGCESPEPPFYLAVGNFDNDGDQFHNDIAFSYEQLFVYEVEQWTDASDWNRGCASGNFGDTPRLITGPASHNGMGRVLTAGSPTDGIINWRDDGLGWFEDVALGDRMYFNAFNEDESIRGSAFVEEAEVNDGLVDSVAWRIANDGSGIKLVAASLVRDPDRDVDFRLADISTISSDEPSDGLVLDDQDGKRVLVLLVGLEVLLIDLEDSNLTVLARHNLAFPAAFLVAPNWGPNGTPVILAFNQDNGAYECLHPTAGGLAACI